MRLVLSILFDTLWFFCSVIASLVCLTVLVCFGDNLVKSAWKSLVDLPEDLAIFTLLVLGVPGFIYFIGWLPRKLLMETCRNKYFFDPPAFDGRDHIQA